MFSSGVCGSPGPNRCAVRRPGVGRPVRRLVAALAAVLLVGSGVPGCTRTDDRDRNTEIRTYAIGLLTSTSGPDAGRGKEANQGAALAVDLVNTVYADLPLPLAGGSGVRGGGQLSLLVGDTEGAPARVEERSAELVRAGAVGLVIADGAGVAEAAGRRTDPLGVALLDAHSTADALTDLNRAGHFRLAPSDRQILQTAFGLLRYQQNRQQPVRRITVVLGSADATLTDRLDRTIRELGGTGGFDVVQMLALGAAADVAKTADKVVQSTPDVVLTGAMEPRLGAAVSDLAGRLRGTAPVVTFGHGATDLDLTRTNVQDVLRLSAWSAEYARRQPVAAAVGAMYEKRFETKMTDIAAEAFTATLALAVAIDVADSPAPDGVRASVQRLSMPATQTIMPWNGIRFDGNGTNELAVGVVEQRANAGFQVVFPRELSASAIIWK